MTANPLGIGFNPPSWMAGACQMGRGLARLVAMRWREEPTRVGQPSSLDSSRCDGWPTCKAQQGVCVDVHVFCPVVFRNCMQQATPHSFLFFSAMYTHARSI
ncbi:hypothetical protein CDEST_13651 [Colletotrichum destructivum]|uniref:Uncharacterized protein n=1 Tax=Colletotrichum destructivum TaxID=34406 RepID=A0AAX4IZT1_9PEZI|nr:hypothetical protein CDEST_13651 [Colletotrichum destructivum]